MILSFALDLTCFNLIKSYSLEGAHHLIGNLGNSPVLTSKSFECLVNIDNRRIKANAWIIVIFRLHLEGVHMQVTVMCMLSKRTIVQ